MRVLIIEDEVRLGEFLKRGLSEHACQTTWVTTVADASDALAESHYDAIVLDLSLPDGCGLALLQDWRNAGFNEPVVILSARVNLEDRISGLNLGADDYLSKPFSLEELVARLRAIGRRQAVKKQTLLERGGIRLDLLGHLVHFNGKLLDLTGREYALLEVFMQNAGRVLTRSFIAEQIWSSSFDFDNNLLDVYMSRLRSKLETAAGKSVFKTVRGIGYQMI
jgi:DNA-binding response OmpR family regulator